MSKKIVALLCLVALALGLCACSDKAVTEQAANAKLPEIVLNTPGYEKWEQSVDYSISSNWLSIPGTIDKEVDVIYYYPTTYSPAAGSGEVIADIDNAGMRNGAQSVLASQVSAFADSCNIYAPYYRQLDGMYALTLSDEQNSELMSYAASQDATRALDYYFNNYNNGRPFILAGHSQGSETLLCLLADYFKEHPEYLSRMVAAYPIGYSVTKDYLTDNPHLKFAQGKSDTGVIVSWNTEGPENAGLHNAVVLAGATSINPLNWKTDDTYAPTSLNLGSRINGEIVQNVADAWIDVERGTLMTNADKSYAMPANDLFGKACFHGMDYDFFYSNIQQNAKDRIKEYLGKS